MRSFLTLMLVFSLALNAADYKPARCKARLPYAGAALYPVPASMPSVAFDLTRPLGDVARRRLDDAMHKAMALTKAKVMTAAFASRDGMWSATLAADGSSSSQRLYWASVGKAFTATIVLQMVDEGKLALSDPIARWVPRFPNAAVITIDDLLQHTGGVFSANEDLVARRKPRYSTPEESIAVAAKHGAMFCPGERWRYSNTGYTILGRIIEGVDQRPYHESVAARVTSRLGLKTLRALAPNESPSDVAPLAPADGSEPVMRPSWGFAAGSVAGSAEEMVLFWQALLTGKLLKAETTARMFEHLYPMFDTGTFYGRGVMLYSFPDDAGGTKTWLGHSGGTPGAKAVVAFSPRDQAFVAVALTGDGSVEATANLLLR